MMIVGDYDNDGDDDFDGDEVDRNSVHVGGQVHGEYLSCSTAVLIVLV